MTPIAHIHTDFPTKFGIPRQAGLIDALKATIVFEPPYRNADALRGLEGFSHIWLLWDFSEAHTEQWHPTVRPPRLGGNRRMGVFATRSPFRPNPIGLSSVRLTKIDLTTPQGPVLHITGADLMDGTPIYDIKPYLPFTDSHPDATCGFATQTKELPPLTIHDPEALLSVFTPKQQEALRAILAHDPRPHYQDDPSRTYALEFAHHEIHFQVTDNLLTITAVTESEE